MLTMVAIETVHHDIVHFCEKSLFNDDDSFDSLPCFFFTKLCMSKVHIHKRDDFDFDIVNFPFLDGDVPCRASYGVYISQLIRVCNHGSLLNL